MLLRRWGGWRIHAGNGGKAEIGNGHDQGLASGELRGADAGQERLPAVNREPLEIAKNASESGVMGKPKIISEAVVKMAGTGQPSEQRRELEKEEQEILKALQRIQEEKNHLELEQDPANSAAS